MPLIVNGETVPEESISEEAARLAGLPAFSDIADERERARRVRAAAELAVADRVILRQDRRDRRASYRSEGD